MDHVTVSTDHELACGALSEASNERGTGPGLRSPSDVPARPARCSLRGRPPVAAGARTASGSRRSTSSCRRFAGTGHPRRLRARLAIAKKVFPHDRMSLLLPTDDGEHIIVYAVPRQRDSCPRGCPCRIIYSAIVATRWDHIIHVDMQTDPRERMTPPAFAGYRAGSRCRCGCRPSSAPHSTSSRWQAGIYTAGTSWSRAASPTTSRWRSRTTGSPRKPRRPRRCAAHGELELLDALLAALTDAGELMRSSTACRTSRRRCCRTTRWSLPVAVAPTRRTCGFTSRRCRPTRNSRR